MTQTEVDWYYLGGGKLQRGKRPKVGTGWERVYLGSLEQREKILFKKKKLQHYEICTLHYVFV